MCPSDDRISFTTALSHRPYKKSKNPLIVSRGISTFAFAYISTLPCHMLAYISGVVLPTTAAKITSSLDCPSGIGCMWTLIVLLSFHLPVMELHSVISWLLLEHQKSNSLCFTAAFLQEPAAKFTVISKMFPNKRLPSNKGIV